MKMKIGGAFLMSTERTDGRYGWYLNREDFTEPVRSMRDTYPTPEDAIDGAIAALDWLNEAA